MYKINDHVLVKNSKSNRRIVVLNNDPNEMHVRRITSLYDKNGNRKDVIPIEKYPDIPKPSGIEKRTFRKTRTGKRTFDRDVLHPKKRLETTSYFFNANTSFSGPIC